MRLPKFIFDGNVPINISLTQGINQGGTQKVVSTYSGVCIFDESAKTVFKKDGVAITLTGIVIINEDIAPDIEKLEGFASVNGGAKMKINNGRRIRDVNGFVHHTELELI